MRALSVLTLLLATMTGCSINTCDEDAICTSGEAGEARPSATPWVAVEGVGCVSDNDCGHNGAKLNRCVSGICHQACSDATGDRAECDHGFVCTQGNLCERREATHPGDRCNTSYDCLGPSNLCLAHVLTGATVCGASCSEGVGRCPAAMRCVDAGEGRFQCASSE
jgi:hypothetical protein